MKILFLVNSLGFGGAERTVSYLSDFFVKYHEDVAICALTNRFDYDLNTNIKVICGNLSTESCNKWEKYFNILRRIIFVNTTVRKEKPDIVFCIIGNMAKFLMGKKKYKLIVSERTNPKFESSKENSQRIKIFKKSDGIIFQTERVRNDYKYICGEKSIVIANAVGNPYVYRTHWQSEGRKVIAAIGRLEPEKDYPILMKAFQKFLDIHSEYILELYGEGKEKEKLEFYIKALNLENRVFLCGVYPDAIVKISDARCYVLTSIYEGMPNTLMEAMGIGMPCISTDCEYGPSELIQNGVNGLLVPVKDVDAICNALCRMVEDEEFAKSCGKNAEKILETNSIDRICTQYRDFFYSCVNKI